MSCDLVTIHPEDFGNQVEITGNLIQKGKMQLQQDLTHNWV